MRGMTNERPPERTVELYLVPGFMGFDHLARLAYFEGVEAYLRAVLAARGIGLRVLVTRTVAAGALAKRAAQLAAEVASFHDPACTSVHFLGHSTGGLDIRLLLSPGSAFDPLGNAMGVPGLPIDRARYRHAIEHTKSAMSLATPHHGTPLANVLLGIGFDRGLRNASWFASKPVSRRLLEGSLRAVGRFSRVLRAAHVETGFLGWIGDVVLERPPDGVADYIASFGEDLGALRNLTQESASLFAAAVEMRSGVDYVSFCTGTDEPRGPIATDDPFVHFNTRMFRLLWPKVAEKNPAYPYAPRAEVESLVATYRADLAAGRDVGALSLSERSNDGLVPTFSQAFGRIGGVFASDHLDCVGMYDHGETTGFVRSGARFDAGRFALLWSRVADVLSA